MYKYIYMCYCFLFFFLENGKNTLRKVKRFLVLSERLEALLTSLAHIPHVPQNKKWYSISPSIYSQNKEKKQKITVRKKTHWEKKKTEKKKKLPKKKKSQIAHLPGLRLFSFLFTNSKRVFHFCFLIRKASLDVLVKKKNALSTCSVIWDR